MTHVPMLTSYVLRVLSEGGHAVHTTLESNEVTLAVYDRDDALVVPRAFAEIGYLSGQGLVEVVCEFVQTTTSPYLRVFVAA